MRLSRTLSSASRWSSWGTTPGWARICGPCVSGSMPSTLSSPPVRAETAPTMRIVVDLPAPLGPSSPKDSPGATSKSIASTAVRSPYFLVRAAAWTTGAGTSANVSRVPRQPRTDFPAAASPQAVQHLSRVRHHERARICRPRDDVDLGRVEVVEADRAHNLLGDPGREGDLHAAAFAVGLRVRSLAAQVRRVREVPPRHVLEPVPLLHEV